MKRVFEWLSELKKIKNKNKKTKYLFLKLKA